TSGDHTHNWVLSENVGATCEEGGYELYTCSICGDEFTVETDALGHDYVPYEQEPSCTEDGYTDYVCSRCGSSYEAEGAPALGHDFTAEVVGDEYCAYFGSCIELSVYYKSCTRCGAASDTDTFTYDFARHQYSPVYTAPTCTEKGYTTSTCALCGSSFITYTEDPLGHDFSDEFTTDVRPTTESTGLKSKHCSRCDAVTEETVIKAIVWADANGDGKATSKDTSYLKKYLAGAVEVTDDILYNCDFNGDGKITSKDLAALKKFMATGVAPY
ncbi:MAG: dockerin type I repeat-containing protein, partial [Clostridia bacterium]|nr:dockerin type I repeat-containing protein [Clostridia bacterium]